MQELQSSEPLSQCITLEMQVWEALVSGDGAADAKHLSDGFLGVYPDGFASKADHTGQLDTGPTVQRFEIEDTRIKHLGPDHVLLSYRATFTRTARTKAEVMYVSSIWERTDGTWINIFSQDTPAAQGM